MIAKLTGVLDSVNGDDDFLVVDVNGVGYLVYASARTRGALPRAGEPISLYIETHIREDYIHLFGFLDATERNWFRLLFTVQGVGAKMALAILSALSPAELARAIVAADAQAITRAQGVGAKLAGRVVSELKDKVGGLGLGAAAHGGAIAPPDPAAADAISALVNLSYRRDEAFGAVGRARQDLGPKASVEALIRAGLKELAS